MAGWMDTLRRGRRLLRRYWQLPSPYRKAVRQAVYWIVMIRAALEVVSFRRVLRYVEARAEAACAEHGTAPADAMAHPPVARTVWSIQAVGRRLMPQRPCLTQALVGRLLLAREGVATTLHIGVAKAAEDLKAHAWLEHEGTILIGGAHARDEYRPFPALNG